MPFRSLFVALALLATAPAALASDKTLEHMKALLESERDSGDRIKLSLDISRTQIELANQSYEEGEVDRATTLVQEAISYAERAATTSRDNNKRVKQTEIALRKISNRLEDIGRTLSVEDRPAVEKAVTRLEELRRLLLTHMFSPPRKDKNKGKSS